MRNRLLALIPAATLLAVIGCQQNSRSDTYYLIAGNLKVPYWKTVNAGFAHAADVYGVTAQLRGPDGNDAKAEADEFHTAVSRHPAGILVSVQDAALMKPEIDAALQQGIPVITVDSDAPLSDRLFFIGTNNLQAGRLGGERLVQKLGGKGNIVFFSIPGQPNLDERLKGYLDVLNEHPQMKVVDTFDIKGDTGVAMDRASQLLGQTGAQKIDAFVCLDSASGKDVAEVLKRGNATDRTLIAMDVDPDTLNLIKSGDIEATVSQKPYTMGYAGLQALVDVHDRLPKPFQTNYQVNAFSPYPIFVDTGTSIVDRSNVDIYLANAAKVQIH
ncbi:substrate-binding domain-containing protein [Granulicella tundricola]|uniref:ABC sugar transporter, periplasmic ligand binding protein n=1 Tax=Granulicella tundricola (strain ATCC BAA-1859 / DSM 23138 / MP5ACTX9) TaxID=1198114 RepID=E8WZP4_GRATM|nr:substrate-binding domain-containing protein [Granulicella tundricola]ADW70018.1 ABC sugar transporter, periplasmic ligand binding protein [Granulicella tundricola MP5ACTX9]